MEPTAQVFSSLRERVVHYNDDSLQTHPVFFIVDSYRNGYVLLAEMERLLSFLALGSTYEERQKVLKVLDDEGDGMVQQDEFVQACILLLWHVPKEQIELATENYSAAVTIQTDRNSQYWRRAAKAVDRLARCCTDPRRRRRSSEGTKASEGYSPSGTNRRVCIAGCMQCKSPQ